jgi:pilus assembly protein CpaB
MNPRRLFMIAGALGLLAVALLWFESSRTGGTVEVFRATRDVDPPGTLRNAYEAVEMPRNAYEPMASQVPTSELEGWVSGTPVVRRVRAGETITFDALQKSADAGLQIGPGMRAVAIEVNAAQAVGYLIRPGDLVDVLGTIPEAQATVTRHILQARRVLAVGQQYRLEDSAFLQSRSFPTVTLEVTPSEAEMIEAYRSMVRQGFALSLRPRGDLEPVRTPGYAVSDLGRQP